MADYGWAGKGNSLHAHVCLGSADERPGWKMLENTKIPKDGITGISETQPKCSVSAGNAKSPS